MKKDKIILMIAVLFGLVIIPFVTVYPEYLSSTILVVITIGIIIVAINSIDKLHKRRELKTKDSIEPFNLTSAESLYLHNYEKEFLKDETARSCLRNCISIFP